MRAVIHIAESDPRIKRVILHGREAYYLDVPDVDEDTFGGIARAFWLGVDEDLDILHWNGIHSARRQEIESEGVEIYTRTLPLEKGRKTVR